MQPNIILVVLDTARADAFEPYGAQPGASPVVADLARAGSLTPRAVAPSCWTVPSHVGMFTGQLARSLGLGQAPDGSFRSTRPAMEHLAPHLLPAVLRDAGYVTAGVSCNAWISPTGGWDIGFDQFTHVPLPRTRPKRKASWSTVRWLVEIIAAEVDNGGRSAAAVMGEWFRHWDGSKPFFWFVNLMECHGPYLPPAPYNDLNPLRRLLAGRDSVRYQPFEPVLRQNLRGIEASPASMQRMQYLYGCAIKVLDDWIGRLTETLSSRGLLDDTALVITADHGENFGEGGCIGHGYSLDERLVHVPMITHGPVQAPSAEPWSLLGLPALLSGVAGMESSPYEPHHPGDAAPSQFDELAQADDHRIQSAREKWGLNDDQIRMLTEPLTMVTDQDGKLVRHGEETFYHDLRRDPLELRRLPGSAAPAELRQALEADALWRRPDSGDIQDPAPSPHADEVAALEEQMRLLGYM